MVAVMWKQEVEEAKENRASLSIFMKIIGKVNFEYIALLQHV